MMFVALNEFNEELLKKAADQLQLHNIQKLFTLHKTETATEDVYDSDYLEPWVQWVSVQTGEPSQKHRIKHLGDAPDTSILQIWETLSLRGISSGIWGAMNARKRSADQCLFFLPDPWTAQEMGDPDELNAFLIPLRQISKNYTYYSTWELVKTLSSFFKLLRSHRLCTTFFKEGAKLIKNLIAYSCKPFVFVSFLDLLSAKLFLKYKKAHRPKFSLLFLNSIAHLQHHQWKQEGLSSNAPLAHGFRNIDRILGELFKEMDPDEILIVANALSQVNTDKDPPWILYRQINHQKFLKAIGIQDAKVEAHMTHDAHLFFPNEASLKKAAKILERVTIKGRPFFLVETYPEAPCKLFYKIIFTDEIKKDALLDANGRKIPFYDYFKSIVKRTGKHIQTGTLFSNAPLFPPRIPNHEIGIKICEYLETLV
jgi:hypothetical protein